MSKFNLFNLSSKQKYHPRPNDYRNYYLELDVKEFIKRLKEELCSDESGLALSDLKKIVVKTAIDKLAGDKLI